MKIKPILFSIFALALLGACKDSTTIVENEVGILRGSVTLYDINGDSLSDRSGATILLQGTSFQTTSQTNGDFQLNNVPAGIYNVIVTKPGYDTDLTSSDQFSGAGTQFLESNVIQAIPSDSLPIVSVSVSVKDSVQFQDTVVNEYTINLSLTPSGIDSNVMKWYEWDIADARTDTGAKNAIIKGAKFDSIKSKPISISINSYNFSYDSYNWKPGDTLYIETRAASRSPFSNSYPGTVSRDILTKKIVLP
jgi:Carboxypeptidase regulatory-like domain